jgi:hypothetical protein
LIAGKSVEVLHLLKCRRSKNPPECEALENPSEREALDVFVGSKAMPDGPKNRKPDPMPLPTVMPMEYEAEVWQDHPYLWECVAEDESEAKDSTKKGPLGRIYF